MATVTVRSFCPPCGKIARSGVIACDSCNRWFHTNCVGLASKEYKKHVDDPSLEWLCQRDDCAEQHNLDFVLNTIKDLVANKKSMEAKCDKLEKEVSEAREEIENLNQYVRRNNVLISSIPEEADEDANQVVINIASKLGVTLEEKDLDIIHRLPSRAKGVPRPLLAKFNSRWQKQKLIASAIAQKPKSDLFGYSNKDKDGKPVPVYFNDHQTKLNASIAKRVRDLKRDELLYGYKIRNGIVSVKVREEEDFKVVNTIEKLKLIEQASE